MEEYNMLFVIVQVLFCFNDVKRYRMMVDVIILLGWLATSESSSELHRS